LGEEKPAASVLASKHRASRDEGVTGVLAVRTSGSPSVSSEVRSLHQVRAQ